MSDVVKLIEAVEGAGWVVDTIEDGSCIARCPSQGCATRIVVRDPGKPPQRRKSSDVVGVAPPNWQEARKFLRERRHKLKVTISDVEDIAGLADGHVLKAEKNQPMRVPQFDTMMNWAAALGVEVWLIPKQLPRQLKARLAEAESKNILTRRASRFEQERLRSYQPWTADRAQRKPAS